MRGLIDYWHEETGLTSTEYALLLALIVVVGILAYSQLMYKIISPGHEEHDHDIRIWKFWR